MINLVALPDFASLPSGESVDDVEDYVQRLVNFAILGSFELFRFVSSQRTMDALIELGRYPFIHQLRPMLARSSSMFFSAEDINHTLNTVFANSIMESECGFSDLLWRDEAFSPPIDHVDGRLLDEMIRLLLMLALWKESECERHLIAVTANQILKVIQTSATVDLIEGENSGRSFPHLLKGAVSAAGSISILLEHINFGEMLRIATTTSQAHAVLKFAALRSMRLAEPQAELDDVPGFVVRESLLLSADRYSLRSTAGRAGRLLRAIVDIILSRNRNQGHALRTSSSGAAPVRRRGADAAWRYDVDNEFHLHLWMCASGPELVKIVTHNDFTLEE